MADITINFGSVTIRQTSLLPGGILVWDGDDWAPWEKGTKFEQAEVARLVMSSPHQSTMPDHMRSVVLGTMKET